MNSGSFDSPAEASPLSEINLVPLIDVMLVLLVIFIVTSPLLTHAVRIDLPRATSTPDDARPDNIQLSIHADGRVYWNGKAVDTDQLDERMGAAARSGTQPELHIRADRTVQYEKVAEVMSLAARAGLARIGFVTEPQGQHR